MLLSVRAAITDAAPQAWAEISYLIKSGLVPVYTGHLLEEQLPNHTVLYLLSVLLLLPMHACFHEPKPTCHDWSHDTDNVTEFVMCRYRQDAPKSVLVSHLSVAQAFAVQTCHAQNVWHVCMSLHGCDVSKGNGTTLPMREPTNAMFDAQVALAVSTFCEWQIVQITLHSQEQVSLRL